MTRRATCTRIAAQAAFAMTLVAALATRSSAQGSPTQRATSGATSGAFTLSSPDITAGATIGAKHVFNGMGCTGENVAPALRWSGAPAGTKSFALTVYDPDAPTGSGFWHWMVYDIPPSAMMLPAGAGAGAGLPAGAHQGMTDFGVKQWGGPCPPPGDKPHRYVFTLFALKTAKLEVPANATSAMVGFNLNANTLAKTGFTAVYGR